MDIEQITRACGKAAIAADELDVDGRHCDAALIRALIAHLQDIADAEHLQDIADAESEAEAPAPPAPAAEPARIDAPKGEGRKRGRPPKPTAPAAEVTPGLPLGDAPPANGASSAEPPAPPASASDPAPVSEIA